MFSCKNFILKYGLFLFLLFLIVLIVLNFKVFMTFFFNQSVTFQFLDNSTSIPYLDTPEGLSKFRNWYKANVDITLQKAIWAQLQVDQFKSKQQSFFIWITLFNLGLFFSSWDPTGISYLLTACSFSQLAELTPFYRQNWLYLDIMYLITYLISITPFFSGIPPLFGSYWYDLYLPFFLHNGSIISYDLFFSQKSSLLEFIRYAPSVHIEYVPNWNLLIDIVVQDHPKLNPILDFSKMHTVEVHKLPLNIDPFFWYIYEVVKSWNLLPVPKPLPLPPA